MNFKFEKVYSRAAGCFLGQLAGDALGSLVEFQNPSDIILKYPNGVRIMSDGGTFNTIAGQPTDDSEMAILLARSIIEHKGYDKNKAFEAYKYWYDSNPFDCGMTISGALQGMLNYQSQANGAMMRISPLAIFGATQELTAVAAWAVEDAALTHPNKVCRDANKLYAMAISLAIQSDISNQELYKEIELWSTELDIEDTVRYMVLKAKDSKPEDFMSQMGWVFIAFQNALWQLLYTESVEDAIVDTIFQGGDTDTNAAICGALLGSVYGMESFPKHWIDTIVNCKPDESNPEVLMPRPKSMWPNDVLELTEKLISL